MSYISKTQFLVIKMYYWQSLQIHWHSLDGYNAKANLGIKRHIYLCTVVAFNAIMDKFVFRLQSNPRRCSLSEAWRLQNQSDCAVFSSGKVTKQIFIYFVIVSCSLLWQHVLCQKPLSIDSTVFWLSCLVSHIIEWEDQQRYLRFLELLNLV